MKYIYLLTALIFVGCSDKSPNVEKTEETKTKSEVANVTKTSEIHERVAEVIEATTLEEQIPEVETQVVKTPAVRSNETMVDEPKVTKKITSDVPASCAMWSDGANICTRISKRKASCTTNPVKYRNISCLQWQ